jgi:hypothetical protein
MRLYFYKWLSFVFLVVFALALPIYTISIEYDLYYKYTHLPNSIKLTLVGIICLIFAFFFFKRYFDMWLNRLEVGVLFIIINYLRRVFWIILLLAAVVYLPRYAAKAEWLLKWILFEHSIAYGIFEPLYLYFKERISARRIKEMAR